MTDQRRLSSVPPAILAVALGILPFLYGAVHLAARVGYVVVAGALLIAHAVLRVRAHRRVAPRGVPVVAGVLAVLWAGLVLIPLPPDVLRVVAPATWRLVSFSPGWHPIAVDPGLAIEGWVTAAAHLAIFVVASASFAGRRGARTFAATLAGIGAVIAVLAVAQALGGASRIYFIGLARGNFYGTFVNGNHTASLLAVCSMASLGLLLRERDPGKRAAWGVASVISSVGVMHSLSRGGIIALAAGLAAFLAGAIATQAAARTRSPDELGRFFRRHAILLMLVGLAVFYLSWLGPQRIGREIATLASLDLPQDYRTRVWEDARHVIGDWPVTGAGGGNFGEVFPAYRTFLTEVRTEMAESEYVQLAVENGLVGVTLLIAGVLALLAKFGGRYAGDPMRFSGAHLGLGAALLVLVSHSLVDFPLRLPAMGAIAAALAGSLAGAVTRTRGVEVARRKKPARNVMRTRAAGWVGIALASWALLPAAIAVEWRETPATVEAARRSVLDAPADASAWLRLARFEERAKNPEAARAAWIRAARLDPSRPEVGRAAAAGLARAGDGEDAAAVLRRAVRLVEREGGAGPMLARLRVDLAEQLVMAADYSGAEAELARAGGEGGPRRLLVRADLLAIRDDAPFSVRNAIDAYGAAAGAMSSAGDAGGARAAQRRALLLAVNSARGMPPEEARTWLEGIAMTQDPGLALREYETLAASGSLDAAAIWAGHGSRPALQLDGFETGVPRLQPLTQGSAATIVEHSLQRHAEVLRLRYPDASTVSDLWEAVVGLRTAEPRAALRIRVKADGRVGEQVCARTGANRVFGHETGVDRDGIHTFVVGGLVPPAGTPTLIEAWCLDTRGRPGPWSISDVSLILLEE